MERDNPEINKKYQSKLWRSMSKLKKIKNPFCEICLEKGIYSATDITHHIEWIDQSNYKDDTVFYNMDNLQSLCQSCHNKIHAKKYNLFDNYGQPIKRPPNKPKIVK